jgi:hypothetical protein
MFNGPHTSWVPKRLQIHCGWNDVVREYHHIVWITTTYETVAKKVGAEETTCQGFDARPSFVKFTESHKGSNAGKIHTYNSHDVGTTTNVDESRE